MHFRRGYADHIPIPRMDAVDDRTCEQLMAYVNRMITLYGEEAAESEIAALDREIDRLVYQLYGIAEDDLNFLRETAGLYA